jgi:hypothetical protein
MHVFLVIVNIRACAKTWTMDGDGRLLFTVKARRRGEDYQ